MEWLASNWLWIAILIGFVALHWFGHGGHGHGSRHRRHSGSTESRDTKPPQVTTTMLSPVAGATTHSLHTNVPSTGTHQSTDNRHGC